MTDAERIKAVMATAGIQMSNAQAVDIWSRYSESLCANWLSLPESDRHLKAVVLDTILGVDKEISETEALYRDLIQSVRQMKADLCKRPASQAAY